MLKENVPLEVLHVGLDQIRKDVAAMGVAPTSVDGRGTASPVMMLVDDILQSRYLMSEEQRAQESSREVLTRSKDNTEAGGQYPADGVSWMDSPIGLGFNDPVRMEVEV